MKFSARPGGAVPEAGHEWRYSAPHQLTERAAAGGFDSRHAQEVIIWKEMK